MHCAFHAPLDDRVSAPKPRCRLGHKSLAGLSVSGSFPRIAKVRAHGRGLEVFDKAHAEHGLQPEML